MWNKSPRLRRTIGWAAIFALPIVTVQMTGWLSGSGAAPAAAAASSAAHQAQLEPAHLALLAARTQSPKLDDEHRALLNHIETLRSQAFGPTPMLHATPPQTVSIAEEVGIDPASNETAQPLPKFTLQAIMTGGAFATGRVLINDRLHTVGDNVDRTNWIITAINAESRKVTLEHEKSQRKVILKLRTLSEGMAD